MPSNKLANTEAQGRSVAARPPHVGRGSHARSTASNGAKTQWTQKPHAAKSAARLARDAVLY